MSSASYLVELINANSMDIMTRKGWRRKLFGETHHYALHALRLVLVPLTINPNDVRHCRYHLCDAAQDVVAVNVQLNRRLGADVRKGG